MSHAARYLFSSNFLPEIDAGAAGSLLAIAERLEHQGHIVDFTWQPQGRYHLPHARLRDIFELPEILRSQIAAQMKRASYDYAIVSQPYAYRAFEWLRPRHRSTVFINRTHGWEDRLIESNRVLRWRNEPPLKKLLSRASEAATKRACARVAEGSDGMIASSDLCAQFIRQRYSLPEERVAVIPHAVAIPAPLRGKVGSATHSGTRMLFVGQYLARKGRAFLERELPAVLDAVPESTLTLVVPAESVRAVESTFRSRKVTVLPWMPREELFAIYRHHDVFLYTSLFEGFGKVFLEAMAAGMCVVGFDEGAIRDIATSGRDALFTAAGDSEGLRNLLLWALANSKQTRQIGKAATETARRYTWDRTSRETHAFCERLRALTGRDAVRENRVRSAEPQVMFYRR